MQIVKTTYLNLSLTALMTFLSCVPARAHAISCHTILVRTGQLMLAFVGRSPMQEGLSIRDQLISRDYADERGIAWAWQEREEALEWRRHGGYLGTYWGPSQFMIDFIMTVPNWRDMTNAQLRSLTNIYHLMNVWDLWENRDVDEMFRPRMNSLRLWDLDRWKIVFPNRPITPALMALRK